MSSTAKESSAKFVTDESTLTDMSKSTDSIVKTVNLASTSQQSTTVFRSIPFHMHHGVTSGTPLGTTMVTQTSTTAVVSPKKPKDTSRSAAIAAKDTSSVCPVVLKLDTVVKSLEGEHVKSGQKRKPDENKVQLAKKSPQNAS